MGARRRQVVFVREGNELLAILIDAPVIAPDLSGNHGAHPRVSLAVRVLEFFGQRYRPFIAALHVRVATSQTARNGANDVGAYAGIMAAKDRTHPAVPGAVVTLDSSSAHLQRSGHVPAELGSGPETVKPLQKVVIIARVPCQRHERVRLIPGAIQ